MPLITNYFYYRHFDITIYFKRFEKRPPEFKFCIMKRIEFLILN